MAKSMGWFQRRIEKVGRTVKPMDLMNETKRLSSSFSWGTMYLFHYDPKLKKTLPHYDTFPLVFPIQSAKGGFLGMNFHYLPYSYRATLMDALYNLRNNKKMDETTKLMLSYQILNKSSKYSYFKPCLKHYLNAHLRSRFLRIESVEWPIALFLPLERFQKQTKEKVWQKIRRSL